MFLFLFASVSVSFPLHDVLKKLFFVNQNGGAKPPWPTVATAPNLPSDKTFSSIEGIYNRNKDLYLVLDPSD